MEEPEFLDTCIATCFPSKAPIQFGKLQTDENLKKKKRNITLMIFCEFLELHNTGVVLCLAKSRTRVS